MNETAFLGLGSNIDAPRHIETGLDELAQLTELRRISSVYRSQAIGFDGDPFLNLVVEVRTALSPGRLHTALREIEVRYGRPANAPKNAARHLDIDILTVGTLSGVIEGVELPRGEVFENAFVLAPFAELAPDRVLPGQTAPLGTLWEHYQRQRPPGSPQQIERTAFCWHGEGLPRLTSPVARRTGLKL